MKTVVQCHSAFRYAEKPISFQWEACKYKVKQIIAEWKTEPGYHFIVITNTEHVFELNYDENSDCWQIKPN